MIKTWTEEAHEKGVEDGLRQLVRTQLEDRFPPLNEQVRQRLATLPANRLVELGRALLKARSLRDLGLED